MSQESLRDPEAVDLGKKTINGGLSTVFTQASTTVINMAGLMVLARIIAPEDFGLIAKVSALTGLVMLIGDMGLTVATVQSKTIDDRQLSALFWVNAVVSSVIGVFIALSAPLISLFYHDPRVIWVSIAMAANAVVIGLGVQHAAILRRRMRFGTIAMIQVIGALVGVGLAISASFTLGYWALLLQVVGKTVACTVGFWICSGWRPSLNLRKTGIRNHLKMGGNFTLSNFINYFVRNGDNVLLAKFWGEQAVGFYAKAYSLLLLPMRQIAGPMSKVAIPALSRLQTEPERYRAFFRKGVSISMVMQIPVTVFAAVSGTELVLTILGPDWKPSIPIFYALIPNLLASSTAPATQWVFLSRGDTGRLVKIVAFNSVFILAAFVVALPYGPVGMAWSFSITSCILRIPSILYCFKPSPVTASDFFPFMMMPALCATVGAIPTLAIAIPMAGLAPWIVLLVKFACFSACYLALISMTEAGKDLTNRLRSHVGQILQRSRRTPLPNPE